MNTFHLILVLVTVLCVVLNAYLGNYVLATFNFVGASVLAIVMMLDNR